MSKSKLQDEQVVSPVNVFVQGYVRLVNRTPSERDITLRNGKGPHLLPFSRTSTGHISEPILKAELTQAVRDMAVRKEINIVEVTE
jgi:hypothetical protein